MTSKFRVSENVADTAAIKALADKIGRVDVLFNCAAIVHHGTVLDASEADWDRSFDVNVKSIHRASDESKYTTGQIHIADGGFAL